MSPATTQTDEDHRSRTETKAPGVAQHVATLLLSYSYGAKARVYGYSWGGELSAETGSAVAAAAHISK